MKKISTVDGRAFARLSTLDDAQVGHYQESEKLKGLIALSRAFNCFFLETVELLNTKIRPQIKAPLSEFYGIFLPRVAIHFQTLCGAEIAARNGYPLQACASLRNVFDAAVLTSAALLKVTDFYSIEGVVPGGALDIAKVKRLRKDTEFQVRNVMTGNDSGLTPETIGELNKIDSIFDYETHGARMSFAMQADSWMKGKGMLPIVPRYSEAEFSLFANRYIEIAWMTLRLLPNLQPPSIHFTQAWKEKWSILDAAFRLTLDAVSAQLGKKFGHAMIEFIEKKFPFTKDSEFPL